MDVQLYSLRITLLQRFTFNVKPTNLLLPRPPRRSSQPTPMYTSIALNLGQNVALCNLITLCIWFQFICRLVAFKAHHFRILYQCCISLHCTASLAQNVTLHQPTKPPTHYTKFCTAKLSIFSRLRFMDLMSVVTIWCRRGGSSGILLLPQDFLCVLCSADCLGCWVYASLHLSSDVTNNI